MGESGDGADAVAVTRRQAREAGAFACLDKGTMARCVDRVLLGAAVHAVLAANAGHS